MTNGYSRKEKSTQITGQISFFLKGKNIFTLLQWKEICIHNQTTVNPWCLLFYFFVILFLCDKNLGRACIFIASTKHRWSRSRIRSIRRTCHTSGLGFAEPKASSSLLQIHQIKKLKMLQGVVTNCSLILTNLKIIYIF
jgi:hypothetical protein